MGFVTILMPALVLGLVLIFLVWGVLRVLPEQLHPTGDAPVGIIVSGIVLVFAFIFGPTVSPATTTLKEARDATLTEAKFKIPSSWLLSFFSNPLIWITKGTT